MRSKECCVASSAPFSSQKPWVSMWKLRAVPQNSNCRVYDSQKYQFLAWADVGFGPLSNLWKGQPLPRILLPILKIHIHPAVDHENCRKHPVHSIAYQIWDQLQKYVLSRAWHHRSYLVHAREGAPRKRSYVLTFISVRDVYDELLPLENRHHPVRAQSHPLLR